MEKKEKRLELRLSKRDMDLIESLALATSRSKAGVIRFAVAMAAALINEKDNPDNPPTKAG